MNWVAVLTVALLLVACGGPSPAPSSSGATARTAVTEGAFKLTFELPRATWQAGDSITGLATLELTEGEVAALSGSGGGLLAFEFSEVGGDRRTQAIWDAACGQHPLSAEDPMTSGIVKTGAYEGSAPAGDFVRQFLDDPLVRLPVGSWDITALAMFTEGADCSGPSHELRATVRIEVTE